MSAALTLGIIAVPACAASDGNSLEDAAKITFNTSGVTISEGSEGCKAEGSEVSITQAGTYVFSGTCEDGSIKVEKEVSGVNIVLDGINLSSKTTSPITLNKGSEAQVTALDGSQNTLSDTAGSNDENAVVKAKSGASLTLGGKGALNIKGLVKNGIKGAAEANIVVEDLSLTIDAADDGISSDDTLEIRSGTLQITAGGDALKSSPDTGDTEVPDTMSKGLITISGGKLSLTAKGDGVQADGGLTITGGELEIKTNGGYTTTLTDDSDSCKGLKSDAGIIVTGGTFDIDSPDDALHTNGDLTVTGGKFTVATGDDGLHADNALIVGDLDTNAGPKINITSSYEGLEGTTITINSGDIHIKASDDGVNAANSKIGERSDLFAININGGNLYIDAGSDGIDSNNNITINGGVTEVYGANRGMDCAIDFDGAFNLNGGTLFGAGQVPTGGTRPYVLVGESDMMGGRGGMRPDGGFGIKDGQIPIPPDDQDGQMFTPPNGQDSHNAQGPNGNGFTHPEKGGRPGDGNRQNGAPDFDNMPSFESAIGIKEGSKIEVKDTQGKTLYTATALGPMSNVIFSSPEITEGESYTVYIDSKAQDSVNAALGTGGSRQTGMGVRPGTRPENTNGAQPSDSDVSGTQQGKPTQSGNGASASKPAENNVIVFEDVSEADWFSSAVKYVTETGLMNGTSELNFSPNLPMTRAMFATVLYRMSGSAKETAQPGSELFNDVKAGLYYSDAVNWASGKGIVGGTGEGMFSPNLSITREQLAVMLYRFATSQTGSEPDAKGDSLLYSDADKISGYAKNAVQWCVNNGVLTGKSGSTFDPKGVATRAEVAAMLERFPKDI